MRQQTKEVLNTFGVKERKALGQYFTPDHVRQATINSLPDIDFNKILEPSFGTGEFLYDLVEKYPHAQIDGYEIDPKLHKLVSYGNLVCGDFLLNEIPDETYDLVIGNPPYFQVRAESVSVKFKSVMGGRPNIFAFFVFEAIRLLKKGGWLSFVIPTSICSGAYFAALRNYIIRHCGVKSVIKFEDKEFQDANQSVVILTLQKGGEHTDGLVISKDKITLFNHYADNLLTEAFSTAKTLKDYGFSVKTGNIVWNQWKNCLTDEYTNERPRLYWSHNIGEGGIKPCLTRPVYFCKDVEKVKPFATPAILVNRTLGAVGKGSLKYAYIPGPGWSPITKYFYAENHVNVIQHEKQYMLSCLMEELRKPEVSELARRITGNTQLSKTELQDLLPINLDQYF